jgi:hypothetical protein
MSGRLDSNQRPPEPHSGALAKLRHAPNFAPVLDVRLLLSLRLEQCQARSLLARSFCHAELRKDEAPYIRQLIQDLGPWFARAVAGLRFQP